MEAPDKVYVQLGSAIPVIGFVGPAWETSRDANTPMVEYIRKEKVLEIIENEIYLTDVARKIDEL